MRSGQSESFGCLTEQKICLGSALLGTCRAWRGSSTWRSPKESSESKKNDTWTFPDPSFCFSHVRHDLRTWLFHIPTARAKGWLLLWADPCEGITVLKRFKDCSGSVPLQELSSQPLLHRVSCSICLWQGGSRFPSQQGHSSQHYKQVVFQVTSWNLMSGRGAELMQETTDKCNRAELSFYQNYPGLWLQPLQQQRCVGSCDLCF